MIIYDSIQKSAQFFFEVFDLGSVEIMKLMRIYILVTPFQ